MRVLAKTSNEYRRRSHHSFSFIRPSRYFTGHHHPNHYRPQFIFHYVFLWAQVCATVSFWTLCATEVSRCFNYFGPSNFVVHRRNMSPTKVKNNDIVIVNNSSTVFDLIVLQLFSIDCFCLLWDGNMCSRVLMIFFFVILSLVFINYPFKIKSILVFS